MARVENSDCSEDENNDVEVIIEEEDDAGNGDELGDDDDDSEITSEDDDNDLAEEVALEREAEDLEAAIIQNPYDYENHAKLIKTLHQLHDVERLRTAFERLRSRMVPDGELWLKRLNVEVLMAQTEQHQKEILKLFEEATIDCFSSELHLEWTKCSLQWGLNGNKKTGSACPISGLAIHQAKIEHAREHLGSPDSPDYKEHVKKYAILLEDALTRPLMDSQILYIQLYEMDENMLKCLEDDFVEKTKQKYLTAKDLLESFLVYEEKILGCVNGEQIHMYKEYIEKVVGFFTEEKYLECKLEDVLMVLFDRALSGNNEQSFIERIVSISRELCSPDKHTRLLRIIARRGPKCALYHTRLINHYEANGGHIEQAKQVLENALSYGLDSLEDYEKIWWDYITFLRRKTDFQNTNEVDLLRDTLKLAWDSLGDSWGDLADPDCRILQFWARMEYELCSDPVKGRQVMEQMLLISDMRNRCSTWQFLINLERARGAQTHKIRALFERAAKHVTDYPPSLLKEYVDFERLYGNAESLEQSEVMCKEKTEEWRKSLDLIKQKSKQLTKQKTDTKVNSSVKGKKRGMNDERHDDYGGKKMKEANSDGGVKRKAVGDDEASTSAKKPRNVKEDDEETLARTLFVSNLPHKVEEEKLKEKLAEFGEIDSLRLVPSHKHFGGCIAYCTYKDKDSLEKALLSDRTPFSGRPMFLSRSKNTKSKPKELLKYATSQEKHKLFVKGLPFSHCTKQKLGDIFGVHGGLKEIRVVTFKDGKPKGLAYIEFENTESSTKALKATDGLEVEGCKISVAYSNPPIKRESQLTSAQDKQPVGHMRKTQLTCLLPRALAIPGLRNPQKIENGNNDMAEADEKPKSNNDFRKMLLEKR